MARERDRLRQSAFRAIAASHSGTMTWLAAIAVAMAMSVSGAQAQNRPPTGDFRIQLPPDPLRTVPIPRALLDDSRVGGGSDDRFLSDIASGDPRSWSDRKKRSVAARSGESRPDVNLPKEVRREVLTVLDGALTESAINALGRRHRVEPIESQAVPLIDATVLRWRIADGRSPDAVTRELSRDVQVRLAQPNLRYFAQQEAPAPSEGDPSEYAVAKLHLPEAHRLARGTDVAIAVIDSGIDVTHPELAGVIAGTYDALNSKEGPHPHGTGVAGAIAAHARLIGTAPGARLIAIRAFGASQIYGAESTSFVVLKALNYAVSQNAQIINMSFAGPRDPMVAQALAAAFTRGTVLVAAAGNAGPKSLPLYPAADSHVIAVTATDSSDRLFANANRGAYIAVAAPGVDILMPGLGERYQVNSGTSFAAAYVSGLAALLIDRNPGITPDGVRAALTSTARDLGPKGRDDQFGAGLADALAAVEAASRSVSPGATNAQPPAASAPR
jgi:hypothetical protein